MSTELTWSVPIDSCGQRQSPDGFVPFPGQELHSEKQDMISFIHAQLQVGVKVLCLGAAPYLETATTTRAAALNRPRGLRWEESGGDGRAPM